VLEFRILGAVSLLGVDRRELRPVLAQPKRVALLAYLAAATSRGFHRRDSLLALFWPELDQEHARAALRQALHGLRRSLGDGSIESRGDEEIGLSASQVWCDAVAFDEAVRAGRHGDAVELHRGDLLDGFFLSGAPEFERWLEEERARRRRQACASAWILADSSHAAGDAALAVHWARRAAVFARDDEGAVRRLIALLGALGDRAGAVQAYDAFARRLVQEYEVEPAAETRALIAAVRAREPEGAPMDAPPGEPEVPRSDAIVAAVIPSELPGEVVAPRRRRAALVAGFATALAMLTLGAALVNGPRSASRQPSDPTALDAGRVVVAAFSNRTGDSTLDNVSRLAGEEITRGLELTEVVEIADPGVAPLTSVVPAGQ
jgi:serine/threonine-protein kinase